MAKKQAKKKTNAGRARAVAPPEMALPTSLVRLDLGCGLAPREGFHGVDLVAPGAERVDLFKFPWPWADDSVDELHTSHLIEHIPDREVEPRDLVSYQRDQVERDGRIFDSGAAWWDRAQADRYVGLDMLIAFFDECWRVLKHEGKLKAICPALRTDRAFQDPTHRRFLAQATFGYFNRDWREAVGLGHYRIRANFGGGCIHTMPTSEQNRSDEARAQRFSELWNVTHDWHADMVAIKQEPPRQ